MPQVKRGVCRTVLLISRWAIKIPALRSYNRGWSGVIWTFTRGWQANLSELEHRNISGVAPVLASILGLVNIYPRCLPITHELSADEWLAIGCPLKQDRKISNLGWLNNKIVFIDYDQWSSDIHIASLPPSDLSV